MAQYIEFAGNHLYLFLALILTVGFLAFTEYQRLFSGTKQITVPAAIRLQNDEEAIFVDAREGGEYKTGHIIDALSHPLSSFAKNLQQLDKYKSKPVVVYCATGMRSNRACSQLRKDGFTSVYNLTGGIAAWEKANLPLVTR